MIGILSQIQIFEENMIEDNKEFEEKFEKRKIDLKYLFIFSNIFYIFF